MARRNFTLANPLYQWPAVLVGAVILVLGVRLWNQPLWLMALISLIVTGILATGFNLGRSGSQKFDDQDLNRELQSTRQQARSLAGRANELRQEATQLLTRPEQLNLLADVQFSCDRAIELPQKLEELAHRLQGSDALLAVEELQQQRQRIKRKLPEAKGLARDQMEQLLASLERNIQLAEQGEDARQAQVLSLSTVISDAAGVLQQIQNRLRTSDLADKSQRAELRSLSEALASTQESLDMLVGR